MRIEIPPSSWQCRCSAHPFLKIDNAQYIAIAVLTHTITKAKLEINFEIQGGIGPLADVTGSAGVNIIISDKLKSRK